MWPDCDEVLYWLTLLYFSLYFSSVYACMCSFPKACHVCYSIVVYSSIVACWRIYHLILFSSSKSGSCLQGLSSILKFNLDYLSWNLSESWSLILKLFRSLFLLTLYNNYFSISHLDLICLTSVGVPTIRTGILPIRMTDYRYLVIFHHGSTCLLAINAKICPIGHTF